MARLAVSVAGGVVGGLIGGGVGFQIGFMAGGILGQALFPDPTQTTYGPRLNDLQVQSSTEGAPIPIVYGGNRLAGNVIWSDGIRETVIEEEVGGGMGKGLGPSAVNVSYSYSVSFAVGLCAGTIGGIRKIWADSKLIYDVSGATPSGKAAINLRIYTGTESQNPDPLIQAIMGAANTPAYRGLAYIVFENLQLADFANHIPNITAEILTDKLDIEPYEVFTESHGGFSNTDTAALLLSEDGFFVYTAQSGKVQKFRSDTNELVLESARIAESIMHNPTDGDDIGGSISTPFPDGSFIVGGCIGAGLSSRTYICRIDPDTLEIVKSAVSPIMSGLYKESCLVGDPELDGIIYVAHSAYANILSFWASSLAYKAETDIPPYCQLVAADDRCYALHNQFGFGVSVLYRVGGDETFDCQAAFGGATDMSWDRVTHCLILSSGTHLYRFNGSEITGTCAVPSAMSLVAQGVRGADGHVYVADYQHIYKVDTQSMTIERQWTATPMGIPITYQLLPTHDEMSVLGTLGPRQVYLDRVQKNPHILGDVVADLCLRAGLSLGQIDTTLLTDTIEGYMWSQPADLRAALDPLTRAFRFDAIEADGKIKFIKRDNAWVASIADSELLVDNPEDEPLAITRQQEAELPRELTLQFLNPEADYQVGVARARRLTVRSVNQPNLNLPIVMIPDQAAQAADGLLREAWISRVSADFRLPQNYGYLSPGDVVTLNTDTESGLWRLIELHQDLPGLMKCKALAYDALTYHSDAVGQHTPVPPGGAIALSGPTALALLDIPLLRDADNDAGFYYAASGYTNAWRGAAIYRSLDAGNSYASIGTVTGNAPIGVTTAALGDFIEGNIWDLVNRINVKLHSPRATLASATELAVYNGANACLIGGELLQYQTATLESNGSYTLSRLLRGRKGTESAIAGHIARERFVALNSITTRRKADSLAHANIVEYFRPVTFGQVIEGAPRITWSNSARGLKPYSPVLLQGGRQLNGDYAIAWHRRTRIGGEWLNHSEAQLGETAESYQIDIMDGATVKRTLTTSTNSAIYTAADQATDFPAGWANLSPAWTEHNSVTSIREFAGNIYIGLMAFSGNGAEIWRFDGIEWDQIGGDGFYGSWAVNTYMYAMSLTVHDGALYAGMFSSVNQGAVWKWHGGVWTKVAGNGVNGSWNSSSIEGVMSLVSDGIYLYAGLGYNAAGDGQVWRFNGSAWTRIAGNGEQGSWTGIYEAVRGLCCQGGALYAGTGSSAGDADIWRYQSGAWSHIGGDGLNGSWAAATYETVRSLAGDDVNLYAGLGDDSGDAEVWSWNGSAWTKIGGDGLNGSWAAATFEQVKCLLWHDGALYAGLGTSAGDAEVWSWNGSAWTKIGGDGVNSSWSGIEEVPALATFEGFVFAGIGGATVHGGIWRYLDTLRACHVKVYQISASVGRGEALNGMLT